MRPMPMLKYLVAPLLVVGALSSPTLAEKRNPLDGQPAIRHKYEMRKLRFELTPEFIVSTNQDYRISFGGALVLRFHILDWLAVGIQGAYTGNANTPLENDIRSVLPDPNTAGYMYRAPQTNLQMHDQRVLNINALGSVFLSLTPWAGKFSLFSAGFASYDFFVDIGGGFVYYTQNGCCSDKSQPDPANLPAGTNPDPNQQDSSQYAGVKAAGMVGVGVHIYFNQWLGMTLEMRDYFVKSNPGGLDTNGDRILNGDDESIQNHLFFGLGLTFMIPPKAKISN